jgi:UDP-N-acetylmuramate dehydrogenase
MVKYSMDIPEKLKQVFGDRIKKDKNISLHLTLRTETVAALYLEAESGEDLKNAVQIASELSIPVFILGGGSNLAILKDRIEALVIRNMYVKKEIINDTEEYADVLFSGGYPMSRVVKETTEAGLSGFEYHLGLPGTIGGAVYMNSKWTMPVSYAGDSLISAQIMSKDGAIRTVNREYFEFAYDYSVLQKTREFFIEGVFRLKKEDPEVLKKRAQDSLRYRKETQPFGVNTGGCFFQNITEEDKVRNKLPTKSAGYLIDKAGLKGKKVGGYVVSDKHANFIINTGTGKPEDLKTILTEIKATIKEKYGVDLKEEVVVI